MYAWIWRKLPFGLPGKLIGSVLLTTAVLSLLWFVVFPWAEPLLPIDDVQVNQDVGDLGDPGVPVEGGEDAPAGDGHDLPYSTEENNSPPPTTPNR